MSNLITKNDLNSIAEVFIVSNTPKYLYDGLKNNSVVISILSRRPAARLASYLEKALSPKRLDPRRAALAYALLISLAERARQGDRAKLQSRDLARLRWAPAIMGFATRIGPSTSQIVRRLEPKQNVRKEYIQMNSSNLIPSKGSSFQIDRSGKQ